MTRANLDQTLANIRANKIRIVHDHIPTSISALSVSAIVVAWALYKPQYQLFFIFWVPAVLILNSIRTWFAFKFQNQALDIETILHSGHYLTFFSIISGILWALLPPVFLKQGDIATLLILAIITNGTAAVTTAPGLSTNASFICYATPVMLSFSTTCLFLQGGYRYVGFFGFFVYALLILLKFRIERPLIDSIRIDLENQRLVKELRIQKLEAERASQDKSKFLAAASHDLRQPLHALGLYLGTLKSKLDTNAQLQLAEKMGAAIQATEELFQRLLDISKLDAGIVTPHIEDCAIKDIFKRLEIRFAPMAQSKNIDLKIQCYEGAIQTDPLLLDRIMDNLVSNAIRYTETGSINIIAAPAGSNVTIEVQDTGRGIPTEELDNIFTEFYQLHNPERDRSKGLGLGLSIVKRLCQLLDHHLEVESSTGQGATFQLTVAAGELDKIAAPDDIKRRPPSWDLTGTNILVIDDEAEIRDAMNELLSSWGCNAICVDSAAEAIQASDEDNKPALIIADYRLRESKTGVDAISQVNIALSDKIPAILITGDTAPARLQEAAKSNFILLHKPVNPAQLRRVVNRLLIRR